MKDDKLDIKEDTIAIGSLKEVVDGEKEELSCRFIGEAKNNNIEEEEEDKEEYRHRFDPNDKSHSSFFSGIRGSMADESKDNEIMKGKWVCALVVLSSI